MSTFYFNDYIFIDGDENLVSSAVADPYSKGCRNKVDNIGKVTSNITGSSMEYEIISMFGDSLSTKPMLVILVPSMNTMGYETRGNRHYSSKVMYGDERERAEHWLTANGYLSRT